MGSVGLEIMRTQEASRAVDDAAGSVMGLDPADQACLVRLTTQPEMSLEDLASSIGVTPKTLRPTVERLLLAGFARRASRNDGREEDRIELTEHARQWMGALWGPVTEDGMRMLARYSRRDLRMLATFLRYVREIEERHARRIRNLLKEPSASRRTNRLRGGLSPAALRRVQLFVEAKLDQQVHIADLASRAGLSEYHFARAFKRSMGTTPRAFIERCRIQRAKKMITGSDTPLAQIAAATGLGTQSRLTTAFRRTTGLTPAVYRRGHR